ncbi:S1 RNA-binding domain-containing protein [Candidatus Babeliales bacterium]|nr:S1 RNA-binding domain-containing protein [Candidatus Babeliales bacterium]
MRSEHNGDSPWNTADTKYPVGSKITGTISNIVNYGLFVEIEKGLEGLVHISEISWNERINDLNSRYNVGQQVDAEVVSIDKANNRMSLSIKRLADDPWKIAAQTFQQGDVVTGTVSNVADFGVFVRLQQGITGLVHVSDISKTEHVAHPSDRFQKGDDIKVVVLTVDKERRRISLGIKQLEEGEEVE